MSLAQPLSAFIFTFLGFCFGVFFDLYRVLRRFSSSGQLLTAATDLLFWFTYTVWVYIVLLRVNAGEVRVFLLMCLAFGAAIYFMWLSRSLVRAWLLVLERIAAMIAWLNRVVEAVVLVISWPYRMLYKYLFLPLSNLLHWLLQPIIRLINALNIWFMAGLKRLLARPRQIMLNYVKAIKQLWGSPPLDE